MGMYGYAEVLRKRPPEAMEPSGPTPEADAGELDYTPISLLPGEVPLGIETYFGEGRQLLPDGTSAADAAPSADSAAAGLPIAQRYSAAVARARRGMAAKAAGIGGAALVARAQGACEAFERVCLGGAAALPREAHSVVAEYDAVLRLIYPQLVLAPHVLSAGVLEQREGQGEGGVHGRLGFGVPPRPARRTTAP
jgi:hypothetical protein